LSVAKNLTVGLRTGVLSGLTIGMEADVRYRRVPKLIPLAALIYALGVNAGLAQDSFRAVCSGFAKKVDDPSEKMGISIDFFDQRSGSASRKYTLSSIYQLKLWQGAVISSTGDSKGAVTLKNRSRLFFSGKFNLANGPEGYSMSLDGKLSQDPGRTSPFAATATLPCVNLTP
jgi:hypothetical protein